VFLLWQITGFTKGQQVIFGVAYARKAVANYFWGY
jgi:hypothetical protein